jgi:hypothetical protein
MNLMNALTARTDGQLEALLSDLPASPSAVLAPVQEAKELVQLKVSHSNIRRDGRWVVPRRLEVENRHGNVVLDFCNAIISQPTLDLSISVGHGNIVLVVPPRWSLTLTASRTAMAPSTSACAATRTPRPS